MNDTFDFAAAGYESPADWSRLHDLLPVPVPKKYRAALKDDRKESVCAVLTELGIEFEVRYDAEAAGRRNS